MEKLGTKDSRIFIQKMHQIFYAGKDEVPVLGKYRVGESQRTVISVGTQVMIREADGRDRAYLLLRLIPVEYMQTSWTFPTEFPAAEIDLISRDGGYVIQSPSMRSRSFLDFIRAYNFQDDYNKVNELAERLETTDSGLMEYKNSKGELCYFYYTGMGQDSNVDILGYIPVSEIRADGIRWGLMLLVCGMLLLLGAVDGMYIMSINRKLRGAVEMAEKASMAKTQFLSSMSHDIRTPMNAVIGMTDIARNNLEDTQLVEECLDKVKMSGEHLLTLINDILDISKVESGKMTLSPDAVSVSALAEELQNIVWQNAADKDIIFEMNVGDMKHDVVMADPLRMKQVLLNLLSNAVKYTEPGGHVKFDITELPSPAVGADKSESALLQFVIADDGMGMSEEFQRGMYTSFARATDSRINTIQGSGLGLAIVKQLVDIMGGSVECDSAEGRGTVFTVTLELPVADDVSAEQAGYDIYTADADADKDEFAGMRVLVAEDNDLNWEIIEMMLGEYGIESERAENGLQCLDMLRASDAQTTGDCSRYDLVLMDVQMPVMDGREAARRLRASDNAYLRDIPVAAMTADAFAEDIQACLEAGMDAHVSKPVDMKQVVGILHRVRKGTLHRRNN